MSAVGCKAYQTVGCCPSGWHVDTQKPKSGCLCAEGWETEEKASPYYAGAAVLSDGPTYIFHDDPKDYLPKDYDQPAMYNKDGNLAKASISKKMTLGVALGAAGVVVLVVAIFILKKSKGGVNGEDNDISLTPQTQIMVSL